MINKITILNKIFLTVLVFSLFITGFSRCYNTNHSRLEDSWETLLYNNLGGISQHTLQTNALPWKFAATSLIIYYNNKEGLDISLKSLSTIYKKFGFLYPTKIENVYTSSILKDNMPLGIVRGTTYLAGIFPVEGINVGCASCHAGTSYGEDGLPRKEVWAGQPNTSINFELYLNEMFNAIAYSLNQDPGVFKNTINKLFPEMSLLERFTINRLLLNPIKKRVLDLQKTINRPIPYPAGGPGLTNGVAALKYQLKTINRKQFDPNEAALTSIPDISSRILRSSLLYDGVYAKNQNRFYEKRLDNISTAVIKDHSFLVSFFTVPTMGISFGKAIELQPQIDNVLSTIYTEYEPKKFPGKVDLELAEQGRISYNENCQSCHGYYAGKLEDLTLVSFPNKLVPWKDILTDSTRFNRMDEKTIKIINSSEYSSHINAKQTNGYVGTILDGIWVTAPYLHNGSVPTLWHLFYPEERPSKFLIGGHMLDYERVGIAFKNDEEGFLNDYLNYPSNYIPFSNPVIYDTSLPGCSNRGHEFEFSNLNDEEKTALIEYLKLL